MKIRKKITTLGCLLLLGLSGLCSCGSPSSDSVGTKSGFVGSCLEAGEDVFAKSEQGQAESTGKSGSESGSQNVGESSTELRYESSMELRYAEHFSVDYYEGGYKMLTVKDGTRVLTVPEGMEIPQVPDDVIVLREPVRDLYLVASAAMVSSMRSIRSGCPGRRRTAGILRKRRKPCEGGISCMQGNITSRIMS